MAWAKDSKLVVDSIYNLYYNLYSAHKGTAFEPSGKDSTGEHWGTGAQRETGTAQGKRAVKIGGRGPELPGHGNYFEA